MDAQIRVAQEVSCLIYETATAKPRSKVDSDDQYEPIVSNLVAHSAGRCELFSRVAEITTPVIVKIKQAGQIPTELYVFSLFQEGGGGHTETTLGPFTSHTMCNVLEALARDRDFATRRCRRWEPANVEGTSDSVREE